MAANLFPLTYSPGIKRDGTEFQSKYCTDGNWVRFQRGKVRKIGGMKGSGNFFLTQRVTKMMIFPWKEGGESLVFICGELGLITQINSPKWNYISSNSINNTPLVNTQMWESETVVDKGAGKTYVVFMKTHNALNINEGKTQSIFFRKNIDTATEGVVEDNPIAGVNPLINGGLVFSSPYLFLYGSNGLVQYSASNNPFDFRGEDDEGDENDSGSIVISSDKVIYGSPIRGGSNSPTILFWTLSTVVRVSNIGLNDEDLFKPDVLSNSSSILSSKCVVEYDGLFFWPGTDRFFVYNGIVQELDNSMNLNYFYDNIDLDRRQQVFGVKNTKYGEIWWFYPVKGVPGDNSRALIYNKRDNLWYDTDISRTAGVFSSDFGFLSTHGKSLIEEENNEVNNLWKHEVGNKQEALLSTGNTSITSIFSYFTTPVFSWSAFPPNSGTDDKSPKLVNRWIDLQRIEPDFVVNEQDGVIHFTVEVHTQEYPQSDAVVTDLISFTADTEKLDMRVQGRNMWLTFASDEFFEAGNITLLLGVGDAR